MDTEANVDEAIEVLQQLGLKEYEARCFVGLTRVSTGTAKKLSDLTEVPRTRIYDAVRVLEAQGLVEVQHSSPQQFRAVSLEEATETLRDQYEDRVDRLQNALNAVPIADEDDESSVQEVWSMSGQDAIENRTEKLIEKATDEIVLVIGDESLLTADFAETLNEVDDDIELMVGTLTPSLQEEVQAAVPAATTFVSGLEWLHGTNAAEDDTAIGRLLMVDRGSILVSSIMPESKSEKAIFGEGFGNGLVVIARRLMAKGLIPVRDPGGGMTERPEPPVGASRSSPPRVLFPRGVTFGRSERVPSTGPIAPAPVDRPILRRSSRRIRSSRRSPGQEASPRGAVDGPLEHVDGPHRRRRYRGAGSGRRPSMVGRRTQ